MGRRPHAVGWAQKQWALHSSPAAPAATMCLSVAYTANHVGASLVRTADRAQRLGHMDTRERFQHPILHNGCLCTALDVFCGHEQLVVLHGIALKIVVVVKERRRAQSIRCSGLAEVWWATARMDCQQLFVLVIVGIGFVVSGLTLVAGSVRGVAMDGCSWMVVRSHAVAGVLWVP